MAKNTYQNTDACCGLYDRKCLASFKRHGKFTHLVQLDAAPHMAVAVI